MGEAMRGCKRFVRPLTWDLGVSDSTAIWFVQNVGRNYHLIDYYESSGAPLGHYIGVLHEKRIKIGPARCEELRTEYGHVA
jgi:hypothetical protein